MTAPKRYTEREMVLAKRRAFVMGVVAKERANLSGHPSEVHVFIRSGKCPPTPEGAAEETYPLPMIERPRVVTDPHSASVEWRVIDTGITPALMWRRKASLSGGESMWKVYPVDNGSCNQPPTPARLTLWAALFDCPNEIALDDGSVSDTPPAGAEI